MKHITIYSFAILLLVFSCKQEEEKKAQPLTMGQLSLSDEHPMPGDELELTYNSEKDVDAFYAYMVGTKNYPLDIDFTKTDNEHTATIKIPDSAVALAFIIKEDDVYDDNDKKGYLVPLYDNDGKQLSGSNAANSYYSVRTGANYGMKPDQKVAADAIRADLDANPDLKTEWEGAYLEFEYRNDKEKGEKLINEYLTALSGKANKTEKEYSSMMNFYRMINQQDNYEAVRKEALENYPKGNTANFDMVQKFQSAPDLAEKEEIFKNYAEANTELENIGNFMAGDLARSYYQKGDMENFNTYITMIDDKSSRASTLNNLAWEAAEKGENLEAAADMSKRSVELVESLQKNPEDKPDFFTKRQYAKNLDFAYCMYADTYALILFKQGKIKEAIAYQEKAHDPKAQDVEANQRFIEYLMADNQHEKVVNKAELFITKGNGNDAIREAYKTAYAKANPDATDAEAKLEALEKEGYNHQVAEIKKTMLDEEAPQFDLKDMKGELVSLEELKGKTVILDFWATWCGPCKASFPGMQEVVTKYKDDENVVLLFVDTFERIPNKEKVVEDFIKSNNYDFHVVYDEPVEGTNNFEVADKYEVTGIPTKVIIGPDGKMKFKSVGYSGSNDKLVKEMDIMIDILKS